VPAYTALKHLHVGAVIASLALFGLRGAWTLFAPDRLGRTWVGIVPHVVDTVLLGSALWLAAQLPAGAGGAWLAAKVGGLVVYVVLGSIALKRGRTRGVRAAALAAALVVFAYIASVAVTKSPLGFLAPR
jgi:uncharacterized membrane protein SirB2